MSLEFEPMANNELELERKPNYEKPKTSPFLDPQNIAGGDQPMDESNSGIMS